MAEGVKSSEIKASTACTKSSSGCWLFFRMLGLQGTCLLELNLSYALAHHGKDLWENIGR